MRGEKITMIDPTLQKQIDEILKKPYERIVTPQEDGSFFGEIREFPGCISSADSAEGAIQELHAVAEGWLLAMIETGQEIQSPLPRYFAIDEPKKSMTVEFPVSTWRSPVDHPSLASRSLSFYIREYAPHN